MNGGKGKIQVHSRVSQGGQDAKAVKNEGIISKFARCAWQAFVWMPIFWPLWISMWMLSPLIGRGGRGKQPDGDEAGDDKDDSRKLSTQGSLGLFIIIAAVVLRVCCQLILSIFFPTYTRHAREFWVSVHIHIVRAHNGVHSLPAINDTDCCKTGWRYRCLDHVGLAGRRSRGTGV